MEKDGIYYYTIAEYANGWGYEQLSANDRMTVGGYSFTTSDNLGLPKLKKTGRRDYEVNLYQAKIIQESIDLLLKRIPLHAENTKKRMDRRLKKKKAIELQPS